MGFRYRKSIKVGGARLNLSKSGIGYSVGTKGFRVTKKAGGGTRTTASIPGTGISYVKDSKNQSWNTTKRNGAGIADTQSSSAVTTSQKAKPSRGPIMTILIWLGVWFASMIGVALVGMAIYPNGSPSAMYSLAVLIVPIVVATKVAVKPKQKAPQPELFGVNQMEPTPTEVFNQEPDEPAAHDQTSETMEPDGYVVRTYHVAGTTFHEFEILSLSTENPNYEMSKRDLIDAGMTDEKIWEYEFAPSDVKLVPEPENPHDPNAVKVVVDGEHIGYIKKGSCKHILKLIAEDRILKIDCEMGGGNYKIVSEDYDDEKDKEVYTLERDKTNYFVVLTIREKI